MSFPHPVSGTSVSQVTWSINGGTQQTAAPVLGTGETTAVLGYLQNDGTLRVTWTFTIPGAGSYTEEQVYDVVTPILPISEIKEIIESDSDEDAITIEKATRNIIKAHCGQDFGKYVGQISVSGSGEPNLRLPRRIISITSINGATTMNNTVAVRGNGWYLMSKNRGVPSIRADFDGWHENPYTSEVPIFAPYASQYYSFTRNREFVIDGVWGWESVPASVTEAAKLLVNDYACGDSIYRDRYVASLTAADWKLQFNDGAFVDTGNVRANQLLAEYVLQRGWVVI